MAKERTATQEIIKLQEQIEKKKAEALDELEGERRDLQNQLKEIERQMAELTISSSIVKDLAARMTRSALAWTRAVMADTWSSRLADSRMERAMKCLISLTKILSQNALILLLL